MYCKPRLSHQGINKGKDIRERHLERFWRAGFGVVFQTTL